MTEPTVREASEGSRVKQEVSGDVVNEAGGLTISDEMNEDAWIWTDRPATNMR